MANREPAAGRLSLVDAPLDVIERIWSERWGLPIVTATRQYLPEDVKGLVLQADGGELRGLITWSVHANEAELVTLDSLVEGRGYGSRLLAAAEAAISRVGVARISVVTTNDNLRAFGLYLRRGYRLVRIHLDAMQSVRTIKPSISTLGLDGNPLQDMWELEKRGPFS